MGHSSVIEEQKVWSQKNVSLNSTSVNISRAILGKLIKFSELHIFHIKKKRAKIIPHVERVIYKIIEIT